MSRRIAIYQSRIIGELRKGKFDSPPDGHGYWKFTWMEKDCLSRIYETPDKDELIPMGSIERVFHCLDLEVWNVTIHHGKAEDAFRLSGLFYLTPQTPKELLGKAIKTALTDHVVQSMIFPGAGDYLTEYADYLLRGDRK